MPYWAVLVVIVVLVVGYYLLSQQARERRRSRVGEDFDSLPNFYANQTYTDCDGQASLGIDDRGRRIAVARKHFQPRTRIYSFQHILSAEIVQNDQVIGSLTPGEPAHRASDNGGNGGGLFGSTGRVKRPAMTGLPQVQPVLGQLTMVGVRVSFRNGEEVDEVLICFYRGKPVNVDGVVGEKAFAEAQVLLGSLDIAMKRAGAPPRGGTGARAERR